ncbi:MAG: arginase [SAR202 cluster bacterium]|jgi:agmatinase|nr:arginase [Chloroflexota bacterium]MQG58882.1 arginase [SAR202 cluster bacterium]MQG67912.1 arginase [SAR202 cluster bacterium]HAL48260.1 arginase [Dehalococcoidia bacterium]|tara:strand:- start:12649 stop:13605 length:957 start_codon:yes stop_codon:yes gene_type:complete
MGRLTYPFAGLVSFLRSDVCTDLDQLDADIAVMGAPTDEGSPFMPGARFGPRGIREHSLRFGKEGYYDGDADRMFLEHEMVNRRIVDVGDADVLPTNVEDTFENITVMTRKILDRGALPVVLGGDHAITFPVVRAYTEPLHVVHFDAHIDYSPFVHGFEYTNSHAFRHIYHMSHVESLTQVGIRSLRNRKEWVDDSVNDGNRVIGMEELWQMGAEQLAAVVPEGERCYVSIDIDVLDLPLVPGCVSAEPNGMTYSELRDTLVALANRSEIVGFDLVEVNPQLDVGTGITSYLAAHTILEFLGHICDQPAWAARRNTGA